MKLQVRVWCNFYKTNVNNILFKDAFECDKTILENSRENEIQNGLVNSLGVGEKLAHRWASSLCGSVLVLKLGGGFIFKNTMSYLISLYVILYILNIT